jgi:hypothetical protein
LGILETISNESEFTRSTVSFKLMVLVKIFGEHKDERLDELTSIIICKKFTTNTEST